MLHAKVWAEVLNINPQVIGREDSFYQLGKDSIATMRMAPLARSLGYLISTLDVMDNPILCDQTVVLKAIEQRILDKYEPFSLIHFRPGDSLSTLKEATRTASNLHPDQITDIHPCTSMQEILMATTARDVDSFVARMIYEMDTTVNTERLLAAFVLLYSYIDILRTRIVETATVGLVQVISDHEGHCSE